MNIYAPIGWWRLFAIVVALIWMATLAHAAERSAGPDDYLQRLRSLAPGDTLNLGPGSYRLGLPLHGINGAPDHPTIVQGPSAGAPAILLARPGANTISFANSSYVVVRDLLIDGLHLPVDGVKAEGTSGPVHHITLERLTLIHQDQAQDIVAISTQCPAWGWVIRDNVIIGAGTGMYLGSSDGTAPFFDGIIEGNAIVDTIGYNIQIKHQIARDTLPGAPTMPRVTALRHNVFSKARDASSGGAARPNVLVGHFPLRGNGRADRYDVSANIFFDNPSETLFQGEGNVTLGRNVFFNAHGDAIILQSHHDRPRRVSFIRNVVVAKRLGIGVTGVDSAGRIEISHNHIYAADPVRGIAVGDNVVGAVEQAPANIANWLTLSTGREMELRGSRSRLNSLTQRLCMSVPPRALDAAHPLCSFLRSLLAGRQ